MDGVLPPVASGNRRHMQTIARLRFGILSGRQQVNPQARVVNALMQKEKADYIDSIL